MNRIDRLLSILLTLQSKKYVTAEKLANKYDLSIRTVYRDIKALNEIGVPVVFEPDRGYCVMDGYFLPPLLFTIEEANALLLLHSLAGKFTDNSITKSSYSALEKIKAVLKYHDWEKFEKITSKIEVYTPTDMNNEQHYLSKIQNAIIEKTILKIDYVDNSNNQTQREIEPIGLIFYTEQWHLIAWCWLRKDYRDFKVNKIKNLTNKPESFRKDHSFTIQEYLKLF